MKNLCDSIKRGINRPAVFKRGACSGWSLILFRFHAMAGVFDRFLQISKIIIALFVKQ